MTDIDPETAIKVYIAAPHELVYIARSWTSSLYHQGIMTTSTWTELSDFELSHFPDAELHELANACLRDINKCQIFVLLNAEDWESKGTGGRHVEMGYAMAQSKPVIVYGDKSNLFHYRSTVFRLAAPGDLAKKIRLVHNEFYK